jgi:hypothetical protein
MREEKGNDISQMNKFNKNNQCIQMGLEQIKIVAEMTNDL